MKIANQKKIFFDFFSLKCLKFLIFLIVILGLIFFGFKLGSYSVYQKLIQDNVIPVRKQGDYKFINPLLECDVQNNYLNNTYIPFEKKLKNSIADLNDKKYQNKEIAVYFRDLNNGPWFGINPSANFTPASLMKVPLMIAYYKQAESDPTILQQKIVFQADLETYPQNIVTGNKLIIGKEYTVEELIDFMIINSDNEAMANLLNNFNQEKLDKVYLDLGIIVPDLREPEDFMSISEYASFFRILYNAAYLNEYYSEKSLDLLSRTKFFDGLVAGVPFGVKVSHKFGERQNNALKTANKQMHECGIIYFPNHPYLLCVMTRGDDFEKMSNFITDVSRLVYRTISETYKY